MERLTSETETRPVNKSEALGSDSGDRVEVEDGAKSKGGALGDKRTRGSRVKNDS